MLCGYLARCRCLVCAWTVYVLTFLTHGFSTSPDKVDGGCRGLQLDRPGPPFGWWGQNSPRGYHKEVHSRVERKRRSEDIVGYLFLLFWEPLSIVFRMNVRCSEIAFWCESCLYYELTGITLAPQKILFEVWGFILRVKRCLLRRACCGNHEHAWHSTLCIQTAIWFIVWDVFEVIGVSWDVPKHPGQSILWSWQVFKQRHSVGDLGKACFL